MKSKLLVPGAGHARRCLRAGFSLLEIVMAIGIVSVAFISVLSLLPIGMGNFRAASDRSIGAWISQQIVNEVQQSDFKTLMANSTALGFRYFDVDGGELKATAGVPAAGTVYHVNVRILQSPTLPGSVNVNENLATVNVQVANNPGNRTLKREANDCWSVTPGVSMTTYSTVISGYAAAGS